MRMHSRSRSWSENSSGRCSRRKTGRQARQCLPRRDPQDRSRAAPGSLRGQRSHSRRRLNTLHCRDVQPKMRCRKACRHRRDKLKTTRSHRQAHRTWRTMRRAALRHSACRNHRVVSQRAGHRMQRRRAMSGSIHIIRRPMLSMLCWSRNGSACARCRRNTAGVRVIWIIPGCRRYSRRNRRHSRCRCRRQAHR